MFVHHTLPPGLTLRDTAQPPSPPAEVLGRVEALWQRELAGGRRLFNGRVFSLERLDGCTAIGHLIQYKWYMAQLADPSLAPYLRVRSLAVCGLVIAQGRVLFGRRHPALALEGGLWELTPSGTIHGKHREKDGSVSYRQQFLEELGEELGVTLPDAQALTPFALVEDTVLGNWDLGIALRLEADPEHIARSHSFGPNDEYTELALVPEAEVAEFVHVRQQEMTGVSRQLLWAWGLTQQP